MGHDANTDSKISLGWSKQGRNFPNSLNLIIHGCLEGKKDIEYL